jgi:hypothetical protein
MAQPLPVFPFGEGELRNAELLSKLSYEQAFFFSEILDIIP